VAVGGGGRYLVLHLPRERKLAVFDANAAQVVKYLPADEDGVRFAAGMSHLLVALPGRRQIERWSLTTFEREASAPLPAGGAVIALALGSASNGPLLFGQAPEQRFGRGTVGFLDIFTLRPLNLRWSREQPPADAAFARASADGRTFAMRNGVGGEPHTVTVVRLQDHAQVYEAWNFPGSVPVPGPDGRFIYAATAVYTDRLQPVFPKVPPTSFAKPFLPAAHGSYFLRLDYAQWDKLGGKLSFFLPGHEQPFAQLDDVEGVTNEQISYGKLRDTLPHDQRVHFIPKAQLVVTIPAGDDRLVLRRFDAEAALKKSGLDYLVVTSDPPPAARKGGTYDYQVTAKARKGTVQYRLDAGPKGMQLAEGGRLTWAVPADFAGEADVIITVSDGAGQECFHAFKIGVRE
jgi:hypothetical protein